MAQAIHLRRHEGAVVAVTGAASGVGAATATRFASEGAMVLLCDINAADEKVAAIEAAGGAALSIQVDMGDPEAANMIVDRAVSAFGGLDVVVHNAGVGAGGTAATITDADVERLLQINLMAGIRLSRAAIPHFRQRGGGVFLFTTALAASHYLPNTVAYSLSKAAVNQLARGIALDHGRENIRANCIAPGPVNTNMLHEACRVFGVPPEAFKTGIPTGRFTEPEEIAAIYAFLASDEARSITGQVIYVDGGMSAGLFPNTPL